jgi:D-amino-acid dehydrogenase
MRVVVLGAGLVGTATAYYLAEAGHEVVVVDRQPGIGLETSFANGGLVTPSTSDSWAAPGTPAKILKWLGRENAPLLLRLRAVPGLTGWGLRFLANCRAGPWRRNTEEVLALALYSMQAYRELLGRADLAFDRNPPGLLKLFRDAMSLDSATRAHRLYGELGVEARLLGAGECVEAEPALAPIRDRISGGVLYPDDESGDAFKFARELGRLAAAKGAEFRFDTAVTGLATEAGRLTAAATDGGPIGGDAFVLALGSYSRDLARRLGIHLPLYPGKGYSITVDVAGWNARPRLPIADDGRKMAVTPLGERLRVAGTVEFTGFDTRLNDVRGRMLVDGLDDILPDRPRDAPIEHWCGLRPMTPDGRPLIGRTRWGNLYVNTGHGPLGFTLACGSGRALADLIAGRRPEIDLAPFAVT